MTKLYHFFLIVPLPLLLLFLLSLPFYETIYFLIDFLHLSFEDLILLLFTAFFSFSFYFLQSCFQYLLLHPWVSQSNTVWQPIPACCPLVTISVSRYILTPSACSIFTFVLSPLRMHHLWTIFSNVLTVTLPPDEQFFSLELRTTLTLYAWVKLRIPPCLSVLREMFHGRFSYSRVFLTYLQNC